MFPVWQRRHARVISNEGTKLMTTTKPAVGYIRVSIDKQEDSPVRQKAEIAKLAQREGYRIIRWYEDHGISGAKTLKRPEFRRMIRDADDRGDFRAILCWDQDRLERFDSIEAGDRGMDYDNMPPEMRILPMRGCYLGFGR